jgi:arabinogalactan endo-1,4-beta-galactosidase
MEKRTCALRWLALVAAVTVFAGCGESDADTPSSTGGLFGSGGEGTTATGGLGGSAGGASVSGGSDPVGSGGGGAAASGGANTGTGATAGSNAGGVSSGGSSVGGSNTGGLGGASTGGVSAGGANTGGSNTGGSNTGGRGTGGADTGGSNTGGRSAGGANTGGRNAGGSDRGGTSVGGSGTGGAATGGSGTGGSGTGGATAALKFMLGADISSVQEAIDGGARYVDTDGTQKSILEILKNHGFNTIRLRTFVKPGAEYGYAQGTGGDCVKRETYCDKAHTIEFAQEIKAAGLQFLLDFHYSDTWADPGKQIIPEDWRNAGSIGALATYVRDYTEDVVSSLVDASARPDMVQIGNETTPGMLIHVPNSSTDCWGNNVSSAPVGGSTSNWNNLGQLLKAGVEGVRSVDPSILTMVHIENTKSASGVVSWVRSALEQGVDIDAVGLSCYVAFQGEPSVWENTFKTLASTFPDLKFVIAEYNPERTEANRIIHDLPNGQGLGTFIWEPTLRGSWGESLFSWSGTTGRANSADFAEYDSIRTMVGL